jgi:hypothetical protein
LIVVIGSACDSVAASLVDSWPSAQLLSAADLTSSGWEWGSDRPGRWVVGGRSVSDRDVSGVFVRRANVYGDELLSIHPDDRGYVAGESHAFLIAVLASTRAIVVNPVFDAALGDEALRPESWMRSAVAAGITVSPIRLTSRTQDQPPLSQRRVDVVGEDTFGKASERCHVGAAALVRMLGLHWATCLFDGRERLLTVTTAAAPAKDSIQTLGRLLTGGES